MATEDDQVGVELAGQLDAATNSGRLAVKTRSRFLAAADRLFGGIFDLPAAKIDVWIDDIKHEAELKRQYRSALAAPITEALEAGDYERARLLKLSASGQLREFDKTLNLAGVVKSAAVALTDETQQSGASANADPKVESEIDEEWLARFQSFAATASTEKMRGLWGRVLAGEAKSPGTFSGASLRFISDLDVSVAEACERAAAKVAQGSVFQEEEDLRGTRLDESLALQSFGILAGVGASLSSVFNNLEQENFHFRSGDFLLSVKQKTPRKFSLRICTVTQLGKEIFSLLPPPQHEVNLRAIAKQIMKAESDNIEELKLLRLGKEITPGTFNVLSDESLV